MRAIGRTTVAALATLELACLLALGGCDRPKPGPDVQTGAPLPGAVKPGAMLASSGPAPTAADLPGAASLPAATYDIAQAAAGQRVYQAVCARCHPPGSQTGAAFRTAWNNRRVSDLQSILVNTMPQDRPGSLTDEQYLDVIAYMLKMNEIPAGSALPADTTALHKLKIGVPEPPAAAPGQRQGQGQGQ
jgi:mono/diheme cytochrome c family protein